LGIVFGTDEFVLAAPHEVEQVIKKLTDAGRPDEVFQLEITYAAAQIYPEVLVIEDFEFFPVSLQQAKAISVKGEGLQSFGFAPGQLNDALTHFVSRIVGVGQCQNFIGTGVPFANQCRNTFCKNCCLACSRTGNHQHRTTHVRDRLGLLLIGDKGKCGRRILGRH